MVQTLLVSHMMLSKQNRCLAINFLKGQKKKDGHTSRAVLRFFNVNFSTCALKMNGKFLACLKLSTSARQLAIFFARFSKLQ